MDGFNKFCKIRTQERHPALEFHIIRKWNSRNNRIFSLGGIMSVFDDRDKDELYDTIKDLTERYSLSEILGMLAFVQKEAER